MSNCLQDELKGLYIKALHLDRPVETMPSDNLVNSLGIDSISAIEILITVEVAFGITIDDADLNASLVDSIDTLANYVTSRK